MGCCSSTTASGDDITDPNQENSTEFTFGGLSSEICEHIFHYIDDLHTFASLLNVSKSWRQTIPTFFRRLNVLATPQLYITPISKSRPLLRRLTHLRQIYAVGTFFEDVVISSDSQSSNPLKNTVHHPKLPFGVLETLTAASCRSLRLLILICFPEMTDSDLRHITSDVHHSLCKLRLAYCMGISAAGVNQLVEAGGSDVDNRFTVLDIRGLPQTDETIARLVKGEDREPVPVEVKPEQILPQELEPAKEESQTALAYKRARDRLQDILKLNKEKSRGYYHMKTLPLQSFSTQNHLLSSSYLTCLLYCSPHLRILNVAGCSCIDSKFVQSIILECPNLRSLDLSYCKGINNPDDWVDALPTQVLDRTDANSLAPTILHSSLAKLRSLRLDGLDESITDTVIRRICVHCPRLRFLSIAHCSRAVSDISLVEIGFRLKKLLAIDLRGCMNISDVGLLSLSPTLRIEEKITLDINPDEDPFSVPDDVEFAFGPGGKPGVASVEGSADAVPDEPESSTRLKVVLLDRGGANITGAALLKFAKRCTQLVYMSFSMVGKISHAETQLVLKELQKKRDVLVTPATRLVTETCIPFSVFSFAFEKAVTDECIFFDFWRDDEHLLSVEEELMHENRKVEKRTEERSTELKKLETRQDAVDGLLSDEAQTQAGLDAETKRIHERAAENALSQIIEEENERMEKLTNEVFDTVSKKMLEIDKAEFELRKKKATRTRTVAKTEAQSDDADDVFFDPYFWIRSKDDQMRGIPYHFDACVFGEVFQSQ
ncbi:hypothetical protein BLNAU_8752 [Blattamonas nauphoetae]|uniref:F-box domain-containing protein n=1 Tax=Blattamonas nauphoetae TaxID=2049346 RepID=A0ABQ9XXL6_9EUKA|nr:hypothetical protein BLNAU_8752 [Blattamonas nauphoetae]